MTKFSIPLVDSLQYVHEDVGIIKNVFIRGVKSSVLFHLRLFLLCND